MRTTIFLVSALLASTPQAPGPSSPLLEQLDAIAQRQLAERAGVIGRIRDQPAAEVRKQEVRARILSLLGGLPEYRGPLNARVMKTTKRDGFAIDHVVFESLPGYWVTANMYLPDGGGRHPAVLMSMGHWDAGKAAGQLLSSNLAKKGFVVLAYDPVGQGERQQAYDARVGRSLIGGPTEQHFSNGAAPPGGRRESTPAIADARSYAVQPARGDRRSDSQQPARRGDSRVCAEVGPGRPPRTYRAA